jgi:muramoyltetrapeptide carboxypeptidase
LPRFLKPRAVRKGDCIAVAAPGFAVDPARLESGAERLRAAGFRVCWRPDVLAQEGYLAGSDARRAAELMQWIRDDGVAAIVCARGGWGAQRVLARLDAARVREARKPLVGFSDVTTLLLWQLRRAGLAGFHGPMLEREAGPSDAELERLVRALAGEPLPPLAGAGRRGGRAEGRLVGGSLTLLAASLGTPWEVDTRGAIVAFEEIGEKPYAIDRDLHHLAAAGKLDAAAGFAVGSLLGCEDPKRATPTADEVVFGVLSRWKKPLVTGLPFGHAQPNLVWPVGVRAALDGKRGELRLLEAGVVGDESRRRVRGAR